MGAAESNTGICNIALARLGAKEITSLESGTDREAVLCRRLFHPARRSTLASHHWNNATRSVQLTEDTNVTPVFFTYAYALPGDLLRVISVHPSDDLNAYCNYRVQNANDTDADSVLLCDSNQVYINYIFDNVDVATMSQGYRDVLAFVLARDLCLALGKSVSKFELTGKEYRRALTIGKSIDGFEEPHQALPEGSWVRSRFGLHSDKLITS
jgi:hypothetical protein